MAGPAVVVPLRPTRALKARLALNHALPGVLLILTGLDALTARPQAHPHPAWFSWLAIAAGVTVLASIVWELRTYDPRHHAAVGWVEVAAGVVMLVEGIEHFKTTKIFQPSLFYFVAAALTVAMGFNLARLAGFRRLRLDDRGMHARLTPFVRVGAAWSELAGARIEGDALVLAHARGGERRVSLGRVANRDEVARAFHLHAARHGVPIGALPPAAARVQQALRAAGSEARVVTLPECPRDPAALAEALGCDVASVAACTLFHARSGGAVVAIVPAGSRLDPMAVAAAAGRPVEPAAPGAAEVLARHGAAALPPVGLPAGARVLLDRSLAQLPRIWCPAGAPEAWVALDPADLARITGATTAALV